MKLTTKCNVTMAGKKMYSMDNLRGTYKDLVPWFNQRLTAPQPKEITYEDIVEYLVTKGRVPKGIMSDLTPQPQHEACKCVARKLNFEQCRNDAVAGGTVCKTHTRRKPRWTIDDPLEEIQRVVEAEKKEKERVAKEKREAQKKAKKDLVEAQKEAKRAKKKARKAKKAKKAVVVRDTEVEESDVESDLSSDVESDVESKVSKVSEEIDYDLPPTDDEDDDKGAKMVKLYKDEVERKKKKTKKKVLYDGESDEEVDSDAELGDILN